jgi:small-conductance mechanosensitive channel
MAMNFDLSPLARLIEAVGAASAKEWMLQVAVAVGALAIGWFVARVSRRNVRVDPKWRFGKGDFESVAFPLMALVLTWGGKRILSTYQNADELLHIVASLLIAYLAIRIAIYVLGHVIPEGGLQRAVLRVIYWVAWAGVVMHITGLLPEVLALLDSHGFTMGKDKTEVTLLDILKGVVAMFLTITLALWLSRITEGRVLSSESMEMTTRIVISKVVRVATLFLAIFVALPLAGIDVTTLSIFGGALAVGLGFGLQKIASNYVSGFIVLLDRSLRIGDIVSVDNRRGEVTAIEARYTVIKGADGVESIIPNEKMITESVSHHTYSDSKVSVVVVVTVAYDSDVDKACGILVEAARRQGRVLAEPPLAARVKQLSERGIELELTVWISDPAAGEGDLRSDILKEVVKAFRAAGITLPYARREVVTIATPEMKNSPATSIS